MTVGSLTVWTNNYVTFDSGVLNTSGPDEISDLWATWTRSICAANGSSIQYTHATDDPHILPDDVDGGDVDLHDHSRPGKLADRQQRVGGQRIVAERLDAAFAVVRILHLLCAKYSSRTIPAKGRTV